MGQISTIILIVAIWIISFVEPSGWAQAIHLPEKINIIILILSAMFYFVLPNKRQQIPSSLVLFIVFTFIVIPLVSINSWQGASYLVAFLIVYIVSQGKISPKVIKYSGLIIAGLGLAILLIYVKGSVLSGWNDNAMAMTGLFSFLYFSIYLIETKGKRIFWILNIITYFYLVLLLGLDCRSGMLFSIIAVVGIIYSGKTKKIFLHGGFTVFMLNIPLLISLLVIWIAQSDFFYELNLWSLKNYDKTIFNGRDSLWDLSFELLGKTNFIGTGKFLLNYHNSGVAALSVFGLLGYICWIKYFSLNINRMKRFISDEIVFASLFAFCLIFVQQTVDLGFISPTPNLLPYMILGIGLGRVRLLQRNRTVIK